MPFDYSINKNTNLAVIQASGYCDVPTGIELLKTMASDPLFNSETVVLAVINSKNTPTLSEAYQLSEAYGSIKTFQGHKLAIVAETVESFVMNGVISIDSQKRGSEMRVFASIDEAMAWLGKREFTN